MLADAKETLLEKSLPLALWSHAVSHVVWVKNCVFTCTLQSPITPYQAYFGRKPDLSSLWLFSCKAYVHIPKINQSKHGEHSAECVHVGFAPEKSGYILYNCKK